MQVNRPREYRPELVNAEKPLSREEKLRAELGLGDGEVDMRPEDEDEAPPPPSRKGGAAGGDTRVKELEKKNQELEARLSAEGAKRDEQVETIKKLANSKISNITKSWEEKLAAKERECEDVQSVAANDADQIAQLMSRMTMLEKQLRDAGVEPSSAKSLMGEAEDRLTAEIGLLRKEVKELKTRPVATSSSNGAERSGQLESENRDLKKTIDNLMEANEKLVSNTKSKIAVLEKELDKHRNRGGDAGGGGGGGGGAGDPELMAKMTQVQKALEDVQAEKDKALAEVAGLKAQLAAAGKGASEETAAAVKEVQRKLLDKEKELTAEKQKVKAVQDDAEIREKDLKRQVEALTAEQEKMTKAGTKELAEVRQRLKRGARKVMEKLQGLREARKAVTEEAQNMKTEMMPIMKNFYQPLKKAIQRIEKDNSGWAEKYKVVVEERKRLHNLVLELKGNIRVFCRIRPMLPHETTLAGNEQAVFFPEDGRPDIAENNIAVLDDAKGTEKIFEFDSSFGPKSTQSEVFAEVEALVVSVLDGYNVCIFAYGQTGSGKTFTMEGSETEQGINPRTLARVFELIRERANAYTYSVEFAILEIYNEEIRDLLDTTPGKKLEVRQGPDGNYVQDLALFPVGSYEEVIDIWGKARNNRTTFSNNVNEHSSRSHLVLSVYVRGENRNTGGSSYGKLHLVDLAGSERLSRTGASGDRLKEAQNINKSLSALGDVIAAAASKQGHIPYRNSKLTHVLQDSLGQDSKTLMIVQASPLGKDAGESLCSLNFASRARQVELGQAKKHTSAGGARPASAKR